MFPAGWCHFIKEHLEHLKKNKPLHLLFFFFTKKKKRVLDFLLPSLNLTLSLPHWLKESRAGLDQWFCRTSCLPLWEGSPLPLWLPPWDRRPLPHQTVPPPGRDQMGEWRQFWEPAAKWVESWSGERLNFRSLLRHELTGRPWPSHSLAA